MKTTSKSKKVPIPEIVPIPLEECEKVANEKGFFVGDEYVSCLGRWIKIVHFGWNRYLKEVTAYVNDGVYEVNLSNFKSGWIKLNESNRDYVLGQINGKLCFHVEDLKQPELINILL